MRIVRYHESASNEVVATALYIERQREYWGVKFIDAVELTVGRIADDPGVAPVVRRVGRGDPVRRRRLRRFPHAVFYQYRAATDEIYILAVAHAKRFPSYWAHRIER